MMEAAGMVVEDSMSNLTSGSNDASISSGNKQEIGAVSVYSQQQPPRASSSTNQSTQLASKKKRNLPGNPDPEAEVIALSPRTLLATNRFICEICNKGFQRDQNLQLHRRGHNLPWKLKQRSNKEVVRKKVYICPETTCVHHDPSRALGDLTGVKKHFSRKHGEKKWKCEKCSKRYAVRSDWKAHSKICGTREYRCDCGTLFSRRDSFITHRAFCDALAEESARAISSDNPLGLGTTTTPSSIQPHLQNHQLLHGSVFPLKREQDQLHLHLQQGFNNMTLPPWLSTAPPDLFSPRLEDQPTIHHHQENANSLNHNPTLSSSFQDASSASPHMSATALLQKAAQMGSVTASKTSCQSAAAGEAAAATTAMLLRPHQAAAHHMISTTAAATAAAGLLMSSSREDQMGSFMHHNHQGLMASFATGCMERQQQQVGAGNPTKTTNDDDHHHGGGDLMGMVNSHHGFEGSSCSYGGDYENFEGMLENSGKDNSGKDQGGGVAVDGRGINNINDGFTRDFLGLRAFPPPPRQFLNLDDLHQIGGLSFNHQHNHHNPPAQW